jgi:actin-related protein
LVISGGTSLAGGFLELFEERFNKRRKKFPIEVSEIRQAKDPLNAVAHGMLIQAMQEYS